MATRLVRDVASPLYRLTLQAYEGGPRWIWQITHLRSGDVVYRSGIFESRLEAKDNFRLLKVLLVTPGALEKRET